MSFVDDTQFHVVEKDGTYRSDDGQSVQLLAGSRISRQQAEVFGLVKPLSGDDLPNLDADTAENQERLHGERSRVAAPENRAKK